MTAVRVPVRVYQETNGTKLHWAVLKGRHDTQKAATTWALLTIPPRVKRLLLAEKRWFVWLTVSGSKRMDDDGLAASCKWIRDAVARFLGVDDGDKSKVRFGYKQVSGPRCVFIEFTSVEKFREGLLEGLENE